MSTPRTAVMALPPGTTVVADGEAINCSFSWLTATGHHVGMTKIPVSWCLAESNAERLAQAVSDFRLAIGLEAMNDRMEILELAR